MTRQRADAALVLSSPLTFPNRPRIVESALGARMPTLGALREYAEAGVLMRDRVAQIKTYELGQPPPGPDDPADDARRALRKQWAQAQRLDDVFADLQPADVKLIGHKINHYDGPGFEGAEVGTLERFGVLTRTEVLTLTDRVLRDGYASPDPVGDPRQPDQGDGRNTDQGRTRGTGQDEGGLLLAGVRRTRRSVFPLLRVAPTRARAAGAGLDPC